MFKQAIVDITFGRNARQMDRENWCMSVPEEEANVSVTVRVLVYLVLTQDILEGVYPFCIGC